VGTLCRKCHLIIRARWHGRHVKDSAEVEFVFVNVYALKE
jgi:hypothetical protein